MSTKIESVQLSEQDLRAAIKEQKFIICEANSEIRRLEEELAKLVSEFKIGDKVRCDNFQDKPVCVVTGVKLRYGEAVYIGKCTKKDGSLGAQEYELYGRLQKVED